MPPLSPKALNRRIILSYVSVPPEVKQVVAEKLIEMGFVTEGKGPRQQQLDRAVEYARAHPRGILAINCEYWTNNADVACEIIRAVKQAAPEIQITAYLKDISLSAGAVFCYPGVDREAEILKVKQTARRLKEAGISFFSIEGYTGLSSPTTAGKDWLASGWQETWRTLIGHRGMVLEGEGLPISVWISNRMVSNGVDLPPDALEPFIDHTELYLQYKFCEARKWGTISLLGWSDLLWLRTQNTAKPSGALPFLYRDSTDIDTLVKQP